MRNYDTLNDEVDIHIQLGHNDRLNLKWPKTTLTARDLKHKIRELRPEYINKVLSLVYMGQRLAEDAIVDVSGSVNILCAVGGDLQLDQPQPVEPDSSQTEPQQGLRAAGFEDEDVQRFAQHLASMYGSLDTMTQLRYENEYVDEDGEPGAIRQPIVDVESIVFFVLGASLGVSAILFIMAGMFTTLSAQRHIIKGMMLGAAISFVLRLVQA